MRYKTCLLIFTVLSFTSASNAKVITTVLLNQKTYYVDVYVNNTNAVIWLRTARNMSSMDDINALTLNVRDVIEGTTAGICRAKELYDNGKTIVGCTATIGTAVCMITPVGETGIGTVACITTINYTVAKGLSDCIDGISGQIARFLGYQKEWNDFALARDISGADLVKIIDHAITKACDDVR